MLRAHARTDSRLSTYNYAETMPSRELLVSAGACVHAHAPQIPLVLSPRAAHRRALFPARLVRRVGRAHRRVA